MSNCAWCSKYGANEFFSFDNGKKQYSQQKFCSKKCLSEYQKDNNTVNWYDAKKRDDEYAASQQRQNLANAAEYEKVRKKVKNFFSKFAIIATLLGLLGLTQFQTNSRVENNFWAILILIGGIYFFKRLKSNESLIGLIIKPREKIILRYVILVAVIVCTLWGILTLFQTKWNSSDAPKKYAISIIFISIGIFYFYKKVKATSNK